MGFSLINFGLTNFGLTQKCYGRFWIISENSKMEIYVGNLPWSTSDQEYGFNEKSMHSVHTEKLKKRRSFLIVTQVVRFKDSV